MLLAALAFTGALVVSCGGDDDDAQGDAPRAGSTTAHSRQPLKGRIIVLAAISLTEAFEEAGDAFERAHPDADVAFNFGSSSALAIQINEGAPGDVFASADTNQMTVVTERGNAGEPRPFTSTVPVVVVPKGSSGVATFADLAKPGLNLVLAAPDVPIGRYARDALTRASATNGGISADFSDKVLANLKSNEPNVRAVLAKVQLGEADAGIVYRTDARASPGITTIDIPQQYNVVAEYPMAVLTASKNKEVAEAFVAFILSSEGQAVMQKFGFSAP